jgi:hypothetical protein
MQSLTTHLKKLQRIKHCVTDLSTINDSSKPKAFLKRLTIYYSRFMPCELVQLVTCRKLNRTSRQHILRLFSFCLFKCLSVYLYANK